MKKIVLSVFILLKMIILADEIIVYGPESMRWIGIEGNEIFHKKTGHKITYIPINGLTARVKLERKRPKADVIVGVTDINYLELKRENLIYGYKPETYKNISNDDFIIDSEWSVTPIDYGMLALNYNYEVLKKELTSFEELKEYKKQFLVQDPRSFTGEGFMLWTIAVYGDRWLEFWRGLKNSILTVSPGWSESFAKFSIGEGNIMSGYASSSIYFHQDGNQNKYKTYIPEEGGYIYLEGASLVNKKVIKKGAKQFMDFILSEEFQKLTFEKNYMFPVIRLNDEKKFDYLPKAKKIVKLDAEYVNKNLDKWRKSLIEVLKSDEKK